MVRVWGLRIQAEVRVEHLARRLKGLVAQDF